MIGSYTCLAYAAGKNAMGNSERASERAAAAVMLFRARNLDQIPAGLSLEPSSIFF